MKRMKVLFGNRRMMVLVTLSIVVLAAAALVASSASFTATSANPGNTFASGSLVIDNSLNDEAAHTQSAILTMANMKPGDHRSGSVTVSNVGTLPGTFTFSKIETDDADNFASELELIVEQDGVEIYNGMLDGFFDVANSDNVLDLGTWAGTNPGPNAVRTYDVTVTWPNNEPADDNGFMGDECTYSFQWDATSL